MKEEIFDWTKIDSYACEQRGHWAMEEHLQPKEPSEALVFGIGFHKAVEVWTKLQLQQPNGGVFYTNNEAIEIAKRHFLEVWERELSLELREKLEIEGDRRSYGNFCKLFEGYCKQFPIEMYDKIVAVEVPFTVPLGRTFIGFEIKWSGVIDRIVEWQGGLYIVDIKTSSYPIDDRFFEKFRLSGQMIGYAWAGEQLGYGKLAGVMVQGIEVKVPQEGVKLKKDGTPYANQGRKLQDMFGIDIIPVSDYLIEEWKRSTLKKIGDIYRAREQGHVKNMGELCNSYNSSCPFKMLCFNPPEMQKDFRERFYRQREWKPLERD